MPSIRFRSSANCASDGVVTVEGKCATGFFSPTPVLLKEKPGMETVIMISSLFISSVT